MKPKIGENLKQKASKCWREHACLDGNSDKPLCEVERCVCNRSLFIRCKTGVNCPYRISFGFSSHVCTCPVRHALYTSQGV